MPPYAIRWSTRYFPSLVPGAISAGAAAPMTDPRGLNRRASVRSETLSLIGEAMSYFGLARALSIDGAPRPRPEWQGGAHRSVDGRRARAAVGRGGRGQASDGGGSAATMAGSSFFFLPW